MSDPNTQPPPVESPAAARLRLRDRWRSIEAQRRAGRTMVAVGLVGAIVAIAGTISGWLFVGELGAATDDSLEVTIETLDAVDDTIDLAADVLASTTDAVEAVADTLDTVSGAFDTGTAAIDDIAGLADTIGPTIEDAASAVRTLETVGGDIDTVLAALSNIPFGPDYDPSAGLGETFGSVADALGTLPDQLSGTATSLTDFTDSAGELQAQLADLAASVQSVSDDLSASDELVDQYRTSVDEARTLATDTRDDLANNVRIMRIFIVLGGITFAVSQIVPLWMGRSLLDEADAADQATRIPAGV